MKKYLASTGVYVGSSGFSNYQGGCSKDRLKSTLQEVFNDFSNAIVLDGSDDWYAELKNSPASLCKKFDVKILADFHTGISGISSSGVVVEQEEFERLRDTCLRTGFDVAKTCNCYNKSGKIDN